MNNQQKTILLHVIIALLCLPIHYFFSDLFKLAILPYILVLLFSRKPDYLPALIIHTTPGNTISLIILLCCLIIAIKNYKVLKAKRVLSILKALLLLLPVFVYFLYKGIFITDLGYSLALQYLAFYLGFFAFFYGILVADKMNNDHFKAIILIILILPVIMFLPLSQKIVVRLFWLALPFAIVVLSSRLFKNKFVITKNLKKWSLLFFILVGIPYGLKFTPILSAIIALLILFFHVKGYKVLFNMMTRFRIGVIIAIIMILAIKSIGDYTIQGEIVDVANSKIVDLKTLIDYIQYKTFDDRAVLWSGGWNFLIESSHFWPTGEVPLYSFTKASGVEIEDIGFGVHNLGLELMRNYGIILGVILTIIYLIIITKLNLVFKYINNSFILLLSATLMGLGLAEALVGQAVLMSMFSFTFLGLVGICYSIAKKQQLINYDKKD